MQENTKTIKSEFMDFLSLLVYRYTNHILKYFKSYDVFPKKKIDLTYQKTSI